MKKISSFDGYLLADITSALTVLLFVLFLAKKASPKLWAYLALASSIILIYQMTFGKSVVKNEKKESGADYINGHSQSAVAVKDENSDQVIFVEPGEKQADVDGVKIDYLRFRKSTPQYSRAGELLIAGVPPEKITEVYKIPDGVHATVTEDNKISVTSLWGRLIYNVRGGKLNTPPDAAWKPLFQAL